MANLPKPRVGGGIMLKAGLAFILIALAIGLLSGATSWLDYFMNNEEPTVTTAPVDPAEG